MNVRKVTGSGSECTPGNSWELDQPEKGSLPLSALYTKLFHPDINDWGANEKRERGRDMAKAKRERGEQVGREGVDLQSGRYLQVKDSHCQHTEAQRTPHRPDNPVDRKRFVSPRRRHCLESRRGCLLRSNYVSAQENGLGSAPGNVSCLAIMRFSSEDCRADGFPLTS